MTFKKGFTPWNKGLPREMQPRYGEKQTHPYFMTGGHYHSRETRNKISKSLTGRRVNEKTKEKLHYINLGRKHTEEWKRMMRDKMTGMNNPSKRLDVKEKIRARAVGRKHTTLSRDKLRLITISRRINGEFNIRPNKPEQYLIQLFQQHNLPFRYVGDGKFWIGYSNPDFVWEEGRKIIEFDGKYWHSLPKQIVKDEKRNLAYLDAGYDVILINENNLDNKRELLTSLQAFTGDI